MEIISRAYLRLFVLVWIMLNIFQFIRDSMLVLCFYFTIIWPKALPKRHSLPKCVFSPVKLIPILTFNPTQDKLFIFDFASLFCLFIKLMKRTACILLFKFSFTGHQSVCFQQIPYFHLPRTETKKLFHYHREMALHLLTFLKV